MNYRKSAFWPTHTRTLAMVIWGLIGSSLFPLYHQELSASFDDEIIDSEIKANQLPDFFPEGISKEESQQITHLFLKLKQKMESIQELDLNPDLYADVDIFLNMPLWALKYESKLSSKEIDLTKNALNEGIKRANALLEGVHPWTEKKGLILRGHQSSVDGSSQLYGIIIPNDYDDSQLHRLDVVLHGRLRPTGAAMLRFSNWLRKRAGKEGTTKQEFIEVYPLGRVTKGYRWAGETDVFEVIDTMSRNYSIDTRQIVLRGFSMGASGTWHIGLKHPDYFAALGPYTGYVDTRFFSMGTARTKLVRLGELPDYQERMFTWIDAVNYVGNAGMVPVVAAIGGADPGFRNHEFMSKAFAQEGMQLINLVAPNIGHKVNPVTYQKQLEIIQLYLDEEKSKIPKSLRFTTWSLKYNRSHWVELLRLKNHYVRAGFVAEIREKDINISKVDNITLFAISNAALNHKISHVTILGNKIRIPGQNILNKKGRTLFGKIDDEWVFLDHNNFAPGKRPNLQGPIDDAFTRPFLCVRGTGEPWNESVARWAESELERFKHEWNKYWIGDLPIKDDRDVTIEDMEEKNLILFGDPGSNHIIARMLPHLPVEWTREGISIGGGAEYPADNHVPILINPNPIQQENDHYVVINSGHTFKEPELSSVTYLLFPRLGDWAVISIEENQDGEVVQAGLFDETWTDIRDLPN